MANIRNLRREASALLRLSKQAFKFIRDYGTGPEADRSALLRELRETIDRADPPAFDDDDSMVHLTMTNPTADAVLKVVGDDAELVTAIRDGLRRTQQRAYLRLDLNHVILRRLHYALTYRAVQAQSASFKRLAKEIESKGLNKNPMEILGRMGL